MKSCLFISFIIFLGLNDFFAQTIGSIKNPTDGLTYKTVDISGKVWLAENLKTSKFNNGEVILQAKNVSEWVNAAKSKTPAWCYYNFDAKNGEVYGKMYNGFAVNDLRGIAPQGWHIATAQEWGVLNSITKGGATQLVAEPTYDVKYNYVDVGGYYERVSCTNCANWNTEYRSKVPCHSCKDTRYVNGKFIPKTKQKVEDKVRKGGWNGSDNYKFGVLPGGCIMYDGSGGGIGTIDKFGYMNGSTSFWTANAQSQVSFNEYNVRLSYSERAVKISDFGNGFYVRCVKGTDEEVKAELQKQQLLLVENKKKECEAKGMIYDAATGNCVAAKQEVDPDAEKLAKTISRYRTILNSFYDPTGWIALDALDPDGYTPHFLSLNVLNHITKQIVDLIGQKASSSDFGSFVEMMSVLKEAYNVPKYKDFFQDNFDPGGKEVFIKMDILINKIKSVCEEVNAVLGYNPLTSPTEKQVREFVFRGQLRSIYKSGKLNLMMMVYTYTNNEPIKSMNTFDELWVPTLNKKDFFNEVSSDYKLIYDYYSKVHKTRNFESCKDILGIYRQTYQKNVFDIPLRVRVQKEIQECWCDKQYEDLDKIGANNMFNSEMKKERKDLVLFLNQLPSATMGDYSIKLNQSVCGIKIR